MKLVVVGGAGVRAPLLMPALARRQAAIGLDEVVLVDNDERKLALIGPLVKHAAERNEGRFRVSWTGDAREALRGAGAVITTIRVGTEEGRVLDERIALDLGVLGQETTGPGGFAMALRTVPAVSHYAHLMQELCPDAWLLNFTNPAGLVVQALAGAFPRLKMAGICDTPSSMHRQVAAAFGRRAAQVPVTFFGLNHLSWMSQALVDGEDVVPRIAQDPQLAARIPELGLFDHELIRLLGLLPNEYLYYYYYRYRALANIQAAAETRGEQVRRLSAELLRDLEEIGNNRPLAWKRYRGYLNSRHSTYMTMESGRSSQMLEEGDEEPPEEGEGYAGVAIDILAAANGSPARVICNVPNGGAITGMEADDVVEVVCTCDASGLHPIPVGAVPEDEYLLMRAVKRYERLTVAAMRNQSHDLAVEALMAHPLVGSYPIARQLVERYLKAHEAYVGQWAA